MEQHEKHGRANSIHSRGHQKPGGASAANRGSQSREKTRVTPSASQCPSVKTCRPACKQLGGRHNHLSRTPPWNVNSDTEGQTPNVPQTHEQQNQSKPKWWLVHKALPGLGARCARGCRTSRQRGPGIPTLPVQCVGRRLQV